MKAPPEVVKWLQSTDSVVFDAVDWSKEDSEENWQKLIDMVATADRKKAIKARDEARTGITDLSKGSFWERAIWPGHAEAGNARTVLLSAANELPKGSPTSNEWVAGCRRSQGTVIAAQDLLTRAGLRADEAKAETIVSEISTAIRSATHALAAPEIITARLPVPVAPAPPVPITPLRPEAKEGAPWWLWLLLGLGVASALEDDGRDY